MWAYCHSCRQRVSNSLWLNIHRRTVRENSLVLRKAANSTIQTVYMLTGLQTNGQSLLTADMTADGSRCHTLYVRGDNFKETEYMWGCVCGTSIQSYEETGNGSSFSIKPSKIDRWTLGVTRRNWRQSTNFVAKNLAVKYMKRKDHWKTFWCTLPSYQLT